MAAMGAGHVIGDGGVAAAAERLGVAGDPYRHVESGHVPVGDANIDQFADQAAGILSNFSWSFRLFAWTRSSSAITALRPTVGSTACSATLAEGLPF